ncbi:MAG: Maf family protein [Clostridiales bacterium]|nr:Maf family protein [Clostridiales bacterium]
MKLILASGSPRRRELLTQVGIEYEVCVSHVEEQTDQTVPEEVVKDLSRQKAEAVASEIKEGIILGADTVVVNKGQILGKPEDEEDAVKMLSGLCGHAHEVITGVTLIKRQENQTKKSVSFAVHTKVHVARMSMQQIEAYVKTKDPLDKAGSYGIQGLFAKYITGIEGDYNNVVGLPVCEVCRQLELFLEED